MARRMKAWAEAVLAEEAGPGAALSEEPPRPEPQRPEPSPDPKSVGASGPGALPAGTVSAPPAPPGLPWAGSGPPEHWLRDIQARRGGPPLDWVTRVKQAAPPLLDGPVREGVMSALPREEDVLPGPAARGLAREPRPAARSAPAAVPPAPAEEPEALPAPAFTARGAWGAEESPSVARSAPSLSASEEPEVPRPPQQDSWGFGPEMLAILQAHSAAAWQPAPPPGPRLARPAPRPRPSPTRDEDGPPRNALRTEGLPFLDEPRPPAAAPLLRAVPPLSSQAPGPAEPVREPRPVGTARGQLLSVDGDSASSHEAEPPRELIFLPRGDGAWDGAHPLMGWGERPAPSAPASAPTQLPFQEGAPRSTEGAATPHPWPELPVPETPEGADPAAELRRWKRHQRLEREQRGD